MEIQNKEIEKAAVYNEARGQVYGQLIENSQNLDKEHLLELFALTIQQIKIQGNQLFNLIKNLGTVDIAKSYQNITEAHINYIDGIGDRIITESNQISAQQTQNSENSLPGDILR